MSDAFDRVPGLVIFEGGFDAVDEIFEADLKECRRSGHRTVFSFFADGLEVLVCSRCGTQFQETP